jgi:hypothetical protein
MIYTVYNLVRITWQALGRVVTGGWMNSPIHSTPYPILGKRCRKTYQPLVCYGERIDQLVRMGWAFNSPVSSRAASIRKEILSDSKISYDVKNRSLTLLLA